MSSDRVCIVVRTKTRQEAWAARNARQQGFEPWLPRVSLSEVLFPGYLFVWTTGRWRSLRSTYGVLDVVMVGERPAYLPPAEIAYIRTMESPTGFVRLPEKPPLVPGEPLAVTAGPFASFSGLCDGMTPANRVRVLLDIFGRATPVELDPAQVERVEPRRRGRS